MAALAGVTGTVFWAADVSDDWGDVLAELTDAYEVSRRAVESGQALVFIVRTDDLLGRRGAGKAMVATGLLSAARSAALETAKAGIPINVLAVEEQTATDIIAAWISQLMQTGGPTGEVVRLGPSHIGKALP